jgi:hypothetical protein
MKSGYTAIFALETSLLLMEKYGASSTGRPEGEDSLRMISVRWSSESGLLAVKAPS